jgi:hypothetical protein
MLILKWSIQDKVCFSQMSQLATKIKALHTLGVILFSFKVGKSS